MGTATTDPVLSSPTPYNHLSISDLDLPRSSTPRYRRRASFGPRPFPNPGDRGHKVRKHRQVPPYINGGKERTGDKPPRSPGRGAEKPPLEPGRGAGNRSRPACLPAPPLPGLSAPRGPSSPPPPSHRRWTHYLSTRWILRPCRPARPAQRWARPTSCAPSGTRESTSSYMCMASSHGGGSPGRLRGGTRCRRFHAPSPAVA